MRLTIVPSIRRGTCYLERTSIVNQSRKDARKLCQWVGGNSVRVIMLCSARNLREIEDKVDNLEKEKIFERTKSRAIKSMEDL